MKKTKLAQEIELILMIAVAVPTLGLLVTAGLWWSVPGIKVLAGYFLPSSVSAVCAPLYRSTTKLKKQRSVRIMADERKGVYVPEKLLSDASLGAQQKLVLAVIISAMDEFNVCRLSSQQIADRLGVTKVAACAARRNLCHAGRVKLLPKTRSNYKILGIRRKTNA